jgi:hypothetical protein
MLTAVRPIVRYVLSPEKLEKARGRSGEGEKLYFITAGSAVLLKV